MSDNNKLKVFESKQIRTEWNEQEQDWYFSVVDVVEVLTGTTNPRRYWSDLKRKMKVEGSQLYEKIVQLKMMSADGKRYASAILESVDVFITGDGDFSDIDIDRPEILSPAAFLAKY